MNNQPKRTQSKLFSIKPPGNGNNNDTENPHRRVVLLLDMDCFYAQCETVRLGLDQSIPLALVQWRSALAVNYPARKYGIKRGDSFKVIQDKSQKKCVAIHLPVTPVIEAALPGNKENKMQGKENTDDDNDGKISMKNYDTNSTTLHTLQPEKDINEVIEDPSQSAYEEEFNKPKEVREEMYRLEKNKMRSPSEGKACLDRYRLASSTIFSLIDETLAEKLGRKNFILERASIDELFIDVSASCFNTVKSDNEENTKNKDADALAKFHSAYDIDAEQVLKETVIHHQDVFDNAEMSDDLGRGLLIGCYIALTIRRAVFDTLGFTMSAGVSTNKLVAKLGASYGKPNGQAVIFPGAMEKLMAETQIRKARMLGGKLGKKVLSLLPESETTMGSIARLLSLDNLVQEIGEESGRWVFDACRGIDYEEVKATLKVLPKSITAFKSFPKVSYPELEKWTALLARDIMKRVDMDNAKNNRIPKSVTVGYTMVPGGAWIGRTFRLPFPADKSFDSRVQKLVDGTRKALTESGHSSFIRIGFSAIDFVMRPKVGIDSFFSKGKNDPSSTKTSTKHSSWSSSDLNSGNGDRKNQKKIGGIDSFFIASMQSRSSTKVGVAAPRDKSIVSSTIEEKALSQKRNQTKSNIKSPLIHQNPSERGLLNWLTEKKDEANEQTTSLEKHVSNDNEISKRLQVSKSNKSKAGCNKTDDNIIDKDEAYAFKLQSMYDREHEALSRIERISSKRKHSSGSKGNRNKKGKIDFFLKK